MRPILKALAPIALVCTLVWAADWAGPGPQRDAWARGESEITKENAKGLQLLWKLKLDNRSKGADALTPGVILGRQITYRGFKEMLIVGGSSDNLINVDADLGRLIWKSHFEYLGGQPQANSTTATCSGALIAAPTMPPPPMRGGAGRGPAPPATPPSGRGLLGRGGAGFGAIQRIWVVSSDGMLHTINSHTGADMEPPVAFVPASARVDSLNISGNVLYATTSGSCGGAPNGVYAIDLTDDAKQVKSFLTNGSIGPARGGAAAGTDGTVYVQAIDGAVRPAGPFNYSVISLSPNDLKLKDYFTPSGVPAIGAASTDTPAAAPVVFRYKERELIVATGGDGRLYLLDSASLGGSDHKTPLHRTEPIAGSDRNTGNGIWGAFASWEDESTGTRWIYALLWRPSPAPFPLANGAAPNGAIAAFKVVEQNGRPQLSPAWISRDMLAPAPPVIANGTVFALSTGGNTRATLYVLDADTGKELYSSGNAVSSFAHNGGIAFANGRAYFGTNDNYLYSFGFPIEH